MVVDIIARDLSDAELMERLVGGDIDPLGEIYLRHGDVVSRLLACAAPGASREDVEDLCQEVFLTAFRIAPRYEERGKLRSWLFKIALGKARGFRRKRWVQARLTRRFEAEKRVHLAQVSDFEDRVPNLEERIARAIERLPAKQREVLVLAATENLSGEEIAAVIGKSHGATRVLLHRARASLRRFLGDLGVDLDSGEDR